jgi:hypothetical protein
LCIFVSQEIWFASFHFFFFKFAEKEKSNFILFFLKKQHLHFKENETIPITPLILPQHKGIFGLFFLDSFWLFLKIYENKKKKEKSKITKK